MSYLLRRMPYQQFLTDKWHEQMHRIENCQECGQCAARCPYNLNPASLLKQMLTDYEQFYTEHI
jgi:uncharacterized protein